MESVKPTELYDTTFFWDVRCQMPEYVVQRYVNIPVDLSRSDLFDQVRMAVEYQVDSSETPIRLAVTESDDGQWACELGTTTGNDPGHSIFDFKSRLHEDTESFNAVMLVPTGIGAKVGGHAGDATPAACVLASVCDTLITHPNVLNASDIIQLPTNAMYVEGSLITQLMMGTIGLRRARNNHVLVLVQAHEEEVFTNAAINSVNAARASYGLNASVVEIDPRFRMTSEYTPSGVAAGRIEGIEYVYDLLDARFGQFDAVAITSVIELPPELHENYYRLGEDVVNPWGGVEAMLTHAVAMRYGLPAAHSPMLESKMIAETDFGIVDPRMAAEIISLAFLQCVLRGLQVSPTVTTASREPSGNSFQSANVSCLVIPDGCLGLPTLAALCNGIPVIAVRGNTNQMRNDLDALPWGPSQFYRVENYLEAAGTVSALKAGIAPVSVLRPLASVAVETVVECCGYSDIGSQGQLGGQLPCSMTHTQTSKLLRNTRAGITGSF